MKPTFRRYSEQELRNAIAASRSIRQTLIHLGVSVKDNTYTAIRRRIDYLKIDTTHFSTSGPAWKRGRQTLLDDYFNGTTKITSHLLRLRLLEEGVFEHKCCNCSRVSWENQKIPLELNHINGNHGDNSLSNLEMLCPNCHALTPHYRGRNKRFKTKTHCKRGHERTEDNLYKSGTCKTCKRDYDKTHRIKKKFGST